MASFVDSLVAPLSVINALIIAVGMREKENISSTFNSLEEIWREYNVYSYNNRSWRRLIKIKGADDKTFIHNILF